METATKYAWYLRVSTQKQGADGYGIGAQRAALAKYTPAAEFVEVESGRRKDRPELLKALDYCKRNGAVLVVARLDRLTRNVALIANIQDSKVKLIIADAPDINELTLHILAAVAQADAKRIGMNTKLGLAEAKRRGVKLGKSMSVDKQAAGRTTLSAVADRKAAKVKPVIESLRAGGATLQGIADQLNDMGVTTPRGKQWTATAVKNAMAR